MMRILSHIPAVIAALLVLATETHAQATSKSVSLDLTESTSSSGLTDSRRSTYSSARTVSAARNVTISVRNMAALPGEFDIEWYLVAKPVDGTRRFIYDMGKKRVSLKAGAFDKFTFESKDLSNYRYRSAYSGYVYKSGDKPDGWIVRAKVGEEIVRVKSSNAQLEQLEKNKDEFAKFVGRAQKSPDDRDNREGQGAAGEKQADEK